MENIIQRNEEYVDVRGLSHRHTVSWGPGVAESRPIAVCYDCLCLISLCRNVMSLSYDWDEVFGWIDCSLAGALGYLPRCLYSPLVMDRMTQYLTEIKCWVGALCFGRQCTQAPGGVCVYPWSTAGVFSEGRVFDRSDWPPGLCGRFGRLC